MAPPDWVMDILSRLGCARRQRLLADPSEKPFWEEVQKPKPAEEEEEDDKPQAVATESPAYEQASHLKDKGNEKFGKGSVEEAVEAWAQAMDVICKTQAPLEDRKTLELRITLLLNLALGHKKLKQMRHVVRCCDEVLLEQPLNVKALFRKADALGELCTWKEAEEAAQRLEESGEEGKKLAVQKREEWRQRRKAADDRQKKMWSAALQEAPSKATPVAEPEPATESPDAPWTMPKIERLSVFDLRRKGLEWAEDEDFSDAIWREGLGRREAVFYQKLSLPLSLLAATALAEIDLPADATIHVLLDGNTAPFGQPHDWGALLQRCPNMRSLTVVYIDIGAVMPEAGQPPIPYGTLLRPTEEGRAGDRVARACRFLGSYSEFQANCKDLPGIVRPCVALWADLAIYGMGDKDLKRRLEALQLVSAAGVPLAVTLGGEVPMHGGPPCVPRVEEFAAQSMAILSVGLGARLSAGWLWNRFVVPLDKGQQGVLAAHAVLGVVQPVAGAAPKSLASVKERVAKRGVELTPWKPPVGMLARNGPPGPGGPGGPGRPGGPNPELDQLRRRQWEAFCEKLRAAGRPIGPEASDEERHRQQMEFMQFCGVTGPPS